MIQFGSGGNMIPRWENFDRDVDIAKPLPSCFTDNSVDRIFTEHVIEHVTHLQAFRFLEHCFRILRPGGRIRMVFPDFSKLVRTLPVTEYTAMMKKFGWGDGSVYSGALTLLIHHGHQAAWNTDLMWAMLTAIGFTAKVTELHLSDDPELTAIEGHWKFVGRPANDAESSAVEGLKPLT
jgi:predicted SAM-dependent methyltransferase